MIFRKYSLLLVVFGLLINGCKNSLNQSDKPIVVVSILPQKYFVEQIADTLLQVEVLVPSGASPETYEPSAKQLKLLSKSSIYFAIGAIDFEVALLGKLKGLNKSTHFVRHSDHLNLMEGSCSHHHNGHNHSHNHGVDPHVWSSPAEVRIMAKTIYLELKNRFPEYDSIFTASFSTFLSDIDSLDAYMSSAFAYTETRTFFVYHPALTYLARDYNLEQVAFEEEGKAPSMAHMKKVIETARNNGVKTVFIQKEFDASTVGTAAADIGGQVKVINPLEYNWLSNMYSMTDKLRDALNGK
jgi:zinc transport system substrate-binding protein